MIYHKNVNKVPVSLRDLFYCFFFYKAVIPQLKGDT